MSKVRTPNLGETWGEAIETAYEYGYKSFLDGRPTMKEEFRRIMEEDGADMARNVMMNDVGTQAIILDGRFNRRLWNAIEDFFEKHRSQEEYERFQREAVVAEDIDVAFEAGAMDAILGLDKDLEKLESLKE